MVQGKSVLCFLSLLIKLPMERTKGGWLPRLAGSLMGREALFVFNPVINLTMIMSHMEEETLYIHGFVQSPRS